MRNPLFSIRRYGSENMGGLSPDFSTTSYIQEAMQKRFPTYTAAIVLQAVELCLDFIYKHEPSLSENRIQSKLGCVGTTDTIVKGYRWDLTGMHGTDFYSASDEFICGISGSMLGPGQFADFVSGRGLKWESRYAGNGSIRSGQKRHVIDCSSGEPVAEIIYRDRGLYGIERSGKCIQVQCDKDQCIYLQGDKPIAICRRIRQSNERIKVSEGVWAILCLTVALPDNLSDDWKLLILTFPGLQFGS